MRRPRLLLDANVLFSACISPRGRAAALVALAEHDLCELVASPHVVQEARRNLEARYPERAAHLEEVLGVVAMVPEAPAALATWAREQGLPDQDAPVLAAAVQARADALVTGDRTHFGALFGRTLRGVRVVPLPAALALVGFKP